MRIDIERTHLSALVILVANLDHLVYPVDPLIKYHGPLWQLLKPQNYETVDHDITLKNLARQAQIHAKAGADMIAPSGMMDGMVTAIREGLDSKGFSHIPIMSYSTKFSSGYYGPFRDVAEVCSKVLEMKKLSDEPSKLEREAILEEV